MVWTLVEPGVAIVAASLATIRPLLRAWHIRGFNSTRRTGQSGGVRSGTNRSAQHATLDLEDPKAGIQLGHMGENQTGRNFSRPQRPRVQLVQAGERDCMGKGYAVGAEERTPGVSATVLGGPYGGEDVPSSMSSFDIGQDAYSQDSGRVGLGPGGR